MVNVVVAPLEESHCDVVAALEQECFGTDAWPREAFFELLETYKESPDFRGQVWVAIAEQNHTVVGYVVLEVTSLGEAELINLAVTPVWRHEGIGRLLVSFVISVCQELGVSLLWLRVRASHSGTVAFYQACGFAARGEFRDYYDEPGEDALIMAIDVPEDEAGES
jgi:ribosomal-protein-alanine acetyltransferase